MFVCFVLFASFWFCDHLCGFHVFYKDSDFCVLFHVFIFNFCVLV
jgi:hypothetical protein